MWHALFLFWLCGFDRSLVSFSLVSETRKEYISRKYDRCGDKEFKNPLS